LSFSFVPAGEQEPARVRLRRLVFEVWQTTLAHAALRLDINPSRLSNLSRGATRMRRSELARIARCEQEAGVQWVAPAVPDLGPAPAVDDDDGVRKTICVATAVADREGRFCLGFHVRHQGWEFPGGKLRRGESLAEGALRELKEETNLESYTGSADFVDFYDEPDWITFVYFCWAKDPAALRDMEPEKHHSFRWCRPGCLPEQMTFEFDRRVVQRLTWVATFSQPWRDRGRSADS
jgi:ADP-ribose pyrophosphatase YjhB (NUDIX family)